MAGLVATLSVWRAGVVPRLSRIVLLLVALLFAITSILMLLPIIEMLPLWALIHIPHVVAIAVIVFGLTFIVQGFATQRQSKESRN